MRAAILLLVMLVSVMLITDTEAGWFRRAARKLKKFIKKWHCGYVNGKIRCYYVHRGKREAESGGSGSAPDSGSENDQQISCSDIGLNEAAKNGEIPHIVLDNVFNLADGDSDDALNRTEYNNYKGMLDLVEACVTSTQTPA